MEKELEFKEIINIIQNHRQSAYRKINEELVMMYYEIGQYLSKKVNAGEYGEGVISKIANKIKEQYPTLNGFSKRNLYQMIQFYEIYKDNQKVRPLVAQLSWTNNLLILRSLLYLFQFVLAFLLSYAYFSYVPPFDGSIDIFKIAFVRENSEKQSFNSKNGI